MSFDAKHHRRHPWMLLAGLAVPLLALPVLGQDATDVVRAEEAPANAIWLDSLDLTDMTQDYGMPHAGQSVDGNPLTLGGLVYKHGVGTHASSEFDIDLKGAATRFLAMAGLDDEKKGSQGSVKFQVWVDGKLATETPVLRGGESKLLSVDLAGAKRLRLVVTDAENGIDSDHGDWAGALIFLKEGATAKPSPLTLPPTPVIPMASGTSSKTAIRGPRVTGTTPGRPFLFLIPVTGQKPFTYSVAGLPAGLKLDKNTGIITGSVKAAGTYTTKVTVKGANGTATRRLTIVAGEHKLAQTPPMGWNSWNVWGTNVDADKVKAAADAMISSGLAAHGFQYINIDDAWEAGRDANGEIQTNEKFPDMKALSDYVHSKGLKLGIYSSPGPQTCGGYTGSYQHEDQDAATWAKWGIDYLKYDWCSYGNIDRSGTLEGFQKPYILMRSSLDKVDRDIVYSLCQYGMGDVWNWGASINANCWRTTGDINDSWGSLKGIAFSQNGHEKGASNGHWNDPDMLCVGQVGWGNPHPSRLKPNEQVLHITMWCLQSAPLLIGCDMTKLDKLTLDLLTNDEVLEVNQDPLGKPAGRTEEAGNTQVWSRRLWDGTMAVGLFNLDSVPQKVTTHFAALGLKGSQPVRDLWAQKNLGSFSSAFTAEVPAHGAILVKVGKPKVTD